MMIVRRGNGFTNKEIKFIKETYPVTPNSVFIKSFPNRSLQCLQQRAFRMGLRKNENAKEILKKFNKERFTILSDVEKAYMAGILDGEGHISFNKYKKRQGYRLSISIANTDKKLMDWIVKHFPYGNLYCYEKKESLKPLYTWMLCSQEKIIYFCKEIFPFLIIKKEQMEIVMRGFSHLSYKERDIMIKKIKNAR